ncbi:MAG: MATE family efflux transporter [Clostridia bacterium]|nr:MATE family efflux transporter [Clostridia bacterium]
MNPIKKLFSVKSFIPSDGGRGELPSSRAAYGNLARIALPSVCEMVLISLIGSIDTMMVGSIGTEAIAAVGLVSQPRMLMLCMFFALNIGVTAIVARRKGQGDRADANRTLRTSLEIIFLLSVLITAIGLTFSRPLMRLAGAKADTIDGANTYFRIITMVIPFNALSMAMCAAQRGIGNTKITMYVNVVSNVVNVILNYLLINGVCVDGNWIIPRLEVKGAAIATAVGMVVGFVLAAYSIFGRHKKEGFLHLRIRDDWRPSIPSAKAVLKVGGNSMLEQIALRIGFFLYARLVADLGTQAYASHIVCMQFLNLSFTFADGIGVASTSLVGQMLGKERPDLSHIYGKIAQRMAMVVALVLASAIAILRYPLVSLFTDDQTVMRLSANVMLIVALFQPLQMQSVITSGALRGAGDTKYVARVMLLCVAVIRPLSAFLAIRLISNYFTPVYAMADIASGAVSMKYWLAYEAPAWALLGAWSASLLDMFLRMVLVMRRFNGGEWHSIKV